jgi:hypothetical protein
MKTKNNAQEKVNGQVTRMIFRAVTVIISVVLISWTVSAQNFWEQVLTNQSSVNVAMQAFENPFELNSNNSTVNANEIKEAAPATNLVDATFESLEAELKFEVEEYNPADFVEEELSTETENYLNANTETNFEAVEATLENQVQKYNAADLVEAELSSQAENFMSTASESNFEAIEIELENQVQEYNAADFVEAELEVEATNNADTDAQFNFAAIEAGLELQVEKYDAAKFVEAELEVEAIEAEMVSQIDTLLKSSEYHAANYVSTEMEIETLKAEQEFLNKAENETAQEADLEVEKYALHLMAHINGSSK